METQNNAKLFSKIATVMGQVRTLEKTGRNNFDKYDYLTADAIATKLGSLLSQAGIAFLPSLVSVESSEYTAKSGGSNFRTVAHFQMTLACTETGATWTSLWSGEAIDRSDKSISKAAVSAVKYFLLKTFLLAGGDEDDADAESPTVSQPQNAPKTTQKPAAPTNGHNDDLWEPDKPVSVAARDSKLAAADTGKSKPITSTQLTRITILGADAYGSEYDGAKLANFISKGAVNSVDDLNSLEADKLIKALEKRIADAANGVPAK